MICDQGLPDGSGTELVRYLQNQSPHLPVIMITAFTPPAQHELEAIGVQACLRKPFDLDVLTDQVYRSLQTPRPTEPPRAIL